ncbi:hypothetical protein M9Y10_007919 [Tritrichomonas musculus]|uniref:Protein kinase domain-containing protein n=1 Tax=Tritrichomonas musculus TaxID=1915356 RepID=A0ABR2J2N9_9EUKA
MHFRFSEENDRSSIEKLAEPFFIKFRLDFERINPEITAIIEYLWEIIRKSVSVFLIKIGYLNARYDRNVHFDEYLISGIKDDDISSEKYIDLMLYSKGSSSSLYLVYLIQKEMICLMKMFSKTEEEKKLFEREHNNYLNIKHPLLPRYLGAAHYLSCNCLIIEYLEGRMLCEIDFSRKSLKATMKIIFEMMIIVAYLHCNGYIYRDLKPNNIIVDENNTVYLIDFDRMIKSSSLNSNPNITENFMTEYLAPEILNRKPFTYKADIYSLWKMVSNILLKSNHKELSKIYEMFIKCASSNEDDRPSISKLIDQFFIQFFSIVFNINEIKTKINYESDIYTFYLFMVAEYQDAGIQKYLLNIYKNGCIIWKDVHNNIIFSYNYKQIYVKSQKNIQYLVPNMKKAIGYCMLVADQNNSNAQYNLGVTYEKGEYVKKDMNKAIYYYTLSANLKNQHAQYNLGSIYYIGKYVKKDINKAIYYFTLAANQNNSNAQFALGQIYFFGKYATKDINKAICYFTLAANQNHAGAQFNLGLIYNNNQYVIKDINKAIHYFKLSADQNDPEAQFSLGLIYYEGQNVTKDINKAFHYFELAANQNNSDALFYLGFIYYEGKYVTKDIDKTIHYFTLAANQNNSDAQFILGIFYFDNQYVTKDINKAINYFTLAANQNHSDAQFNLGLIYKNGQYVAKDINKAIHYYTLAANQNNSKAQFGLGAIYYAGLHVAQNIDKAIHYYMLAANQNHSKAQFNLGVIYYKGQYVARDMNKAIHYFTLASSQNYSNAQYSLGLIYGKGEYVAKDINKSIHYYTLAANKNHSVAQFDLGLKYFGGQSVARDIKKGIYLITLSSINGFTPANFFVGCIYHAGKYAKRDIDKAIHYYKEASSFNIKQAKNNLGILYKNGFNEVVTKNLGLSIDYFKEAIHQKNDILSMYNLAHLYLYEDPIKNSIDESIKLLIRSVNEGAFQPSMKLLCLALLKRYGFYLDIIKEEVEERSGSNKELAFKVCKKISDMQLYDEKYFESQYEYYRNIDFLYNHKLKPILSKSINDIEYIGNSIQSSKIPKISKMFYEGFSFEI